MDFDQQLKEEGQGGSWPVQQQMSYSPNSLKGGYIGDYTGNYYRGY